MKSLKSLLLKIVAGWWLLAAGQLQAQTMVPVDLYLQSLRFAIPTNPSGYLQPPGRPIFVTLPGFNRRGTEVACALEGYEFLRAVCSEANAQCNFISGDPACWLPTRARFESLSVRYAVVQFAQTVFESFRTNQNILDQCCDSSDYPSLCRQNFQNTRMSIITDRSFNDETCQFRYQSRTLRVSEGMLLGCRDEACITSSIIHELGHACAFARLGSAEDQAVYLSGVQNVDFCRGTQRSVTQMLKMYRNVFGEEVASCVVRGIASRPGGCFATRLQEAFADGMFMNVRTQLSEFAWDCYEREDVTHARPSSYEHCLLNQPRVRHNFCH